MANCTIAAVSERPLERCAFFRSGGARYRSRATDMIGPAAGTAATVPGATAACGCQAYVAWLDSAWLCILSATSERMSWSGSIAATCDAGEVSIELGRGPVSY